MHAAQLVQCTVGGPQVLFLALLLACGRGRTIWMFVMCCVLGVNSSDGRSPPADGGCVFTGDLASYVLKPLLEMGLRHISPIV